MVEVLEFLERHEEVAIVGIGGMIAIVITLMCLVASTIRTIKLGERDLELKQMLVERGLPADEIERILKA